MKSLVPLWRQLDLFFVPDYCRHRERAPRVRLSCTLPFLFPPFAQSGSSVDLPPPSRPLNIGTYCSAWSSPCVLPPYHASVYRVPLSPPCWQKAVASKRCCIGSVWMASIAGRWVVTLSFTHCFFFFGHFSSASAVDIDCMTDRSLKDYYRTDCTFIKYLQPAAWTSVSPCSAPCQIWNLDRQPCRHAGMT